MLLPYYWPKSIRFNVLLNMFSLVVLDVIKPYFNYLRFMVLKNLFFVLWFLFDGTNLLEVLMLWTCLSRWIYGYHPAWWTNFQKKQKKTNQGASNNNKSFIVVPYMKGLAESCKNICRRYGVEVYFKGGRTIKDILGHPKDKDTILKKSGVIYKYSCGRVDCGEEYIGESGRTFGERYREHMRSPSPIMDHYNTTGHEVSLDNFTIVGRENNNIARNIREAIFTRVNDPSLNRNIGKFQLPHI